MISGCFSLPPLCPGSTETVSPASFPVPGAAAVCEADPDDVPAVADPGEEVPAEADPWTVGTCAVDADPGDPHAASAIAGTIASAAPSLFRRIISLPAAT